MEIEKINSSEIITSYYYENNTQINLQEEILTSKNPTKTKAGLRRQNAEVMLMANIQALSTPSEYEIYINDLKNIEEYMVEIFKFTYGVKAFKLDEYKEFVLIQKANYLAALDTQVAWDILEKEGLIDYIDREEPEIPLNPIISGCTRYQLEKKFFLKNLTLIEIFIQKHHEYAYGKGSKNSKECKEDVKRYQARFLAGFDNSTADEILRDKKLLDYLD